MSPANAPPPDVSFAMASYNSMPYLDEAVASALAQDAVEVELLIVDDGSSDDSVARGRWWAARDPRVRFLQTETNRGPGGARNLAIEKMRGTWFAVLDSDDRVLPHRSRALIDEADRSGADAIADDLTVFGNGIESETFLKGPGSEPYWLGLEEYFAQSALYGDAPNPGFLKPMIRRAALDANGLLYNPALRIAEDDELIVRLLLAGCRYRVLPRAMYEYRKHAASISHRLSADHADRMVASETELRSRLQRDGLVTPAYRKRWNALKAAAAFAHAIEALQARRPLAAAKAILRRPSALPLFAMPIGARLRRLRDVRRSA